MVASVWEWDIGFMLWTFGWKAVVAIVLSTTCYFFLFKKQIAELREAYSSYRFRTHIQGRFISRNELRKSFDELELIVSAMRKIF